MGETISRDHERELLGMASIALKDIMFKPSQEPKPKKPSKKLQQVVTKIGSTFMTLEDSINEALELGRTEGFTDMQIGDMIRAEFKRINRPRMTLSRYLPATAKHMEKARPKPESGNRMLPNKPVAMNKTLPTTNTTSTNIATKLEQKQEGNPGKWNQDPLEYKIEEIEQYDIDYLRLAVKALDKLRNNFIQQAYKWQVKFDDMQREKKALKEENTKLKVDLKEGIAHLQEAAALIEKQNNVIERMKKKINDEIQALT